MSLHVDPAELAGRLARDAHGRPLGEVETVFEDKEEGGSRFVGIDTDGGRVVVPVDGAEVDPTVYALDLPYMIDRISGAPTVSPDTDDLEREPIPPGEAPAESAGGPQLDEPPIEIVLWAEEPVVTTRAVPTERVRVLRTLGSQQQDLTAQLRRERASFDHEPGDEHT